ncbi:hypothetical protein HYV21_02145 [Candidatus Microgenomates bacterium]|nr:hypothetical protein [Candidatus Microgenomates bacterium]
MANVPPKATTRVALNNSLIAITIGVFFLTINLKQELLLPRVLILQFILAIPLLFTSSLAYSKVGYRDKIERWNKLAWITFILGYAFILNVIGIFVGNIIGTLESIVFFIITWVLVIIYSLVDLSYKQTVLRERLAKDSIFILIQLILGMLPTLGVISF